MHQPYSESGHWRIPTKLELKVEQDQQQNRLVCSKCGRKLGQPGSSPAVKVGIGVYRHMDCR